MRTRRISRNKKNKTKKSRNTNKMAKPKKVDGEIFFPDHPDFRPNLTPREMFKLGSFGGTYWRPIKSKFFKEKLKDQHLKYPSNLADLQFHCPN